MFWGTSDENMAVAVAVTHQADPHTRNLWQIPAGLKEYFGEMPWLALPYEDRDLRNKLSKKFKVSGIPSLVIVNASGETITTTLMSRHP